MSKNSLAGEPPHAQPEQKTLGEFAFEIFCAVIFLGMIGLVFYNAFLRYVFGSSFAPSEEWARFLFIYITFFGAIEAFYRNKHISVDMFVGMFVGAKRKFFDILATLLTMLVLALLLWGGVVLVEQTIDTNSVATGVNMAFINGTLPLMALASLAIKLRDLIVIIKKPAAEFKPAEEFVMPDEV